MQKILTDLFIKSDYDNSSIEVSFTSPTGCSECSWQILSDKKLISEGSSQLTSPKTVKIFEQIPNFTAWELENPHLYKFLLTLKINDQTYEISENFGMRKFECRGKWIYLNNEKIYLKGHIRGREAHDHPNLLNMDLPEFYEKNIKQAKKFGFNLVRFHSRIPDQIFLEAADKLGILVHVELRKYFGKYQKERRMMSDEGEILDKQQWIETIKKLRNHSCVFAYCMGNEIRKPGRNPFVREIAEITKQIDPTRMFIDTCAHGEYDRDYVDFDVQHMSYYYPYGSNYDMFDNTYNWHVYGSCDENKAFIKDADNYSLKRTLNIDRPVLAHEICHYVALHDIFELDKKFTQNNIEKPWWIDQIKRLAADKNLETDYQKLYKASKEFQKTSWKFGIEAARRSKLLAGYHFLQLSDTDLYENSNGIIDCFDDKRYVDSEFFKSFNSDTVILADLPKRTFFAGDKAIIPVAISHFDKKLKETSNFTFKLYDEDKNVVCQDTLEQMETDKLGLYEICKLSIKMPKLFKARQLSLELSLKFSDNAEVKNNWQIWVFPNQPESIKDIDCKIELDNLDFSARYPNINSNDNSNLLIKNRFDDEIFKHLNEGKDALILYRIPETRSRINDTKPEKYYFPATWDRFKGVIWDRGTFCGGFLRNHPLTKNFPNNGFLDLQFHDLIDDCDKLVLDDFPINVEPVIQGVDKAVRDRFDVYTYKLSELQPEWTMRKFAYLFELKVNKGRLIVCGFNFSQVQTQNPAACYMFECILKYATSDNFNPSASISVDELKQYLVKKANAPRTPERKMTQFWQLNNEPLETDIYWKQAEEFIERNSRPK